MSAAITNMTRIEDGPVATVYSGHHTGVPVALKVFPKRFDKRTMSAFTKEQTRLATVRRVTSILMVDGVEELPSGEPALRMELCTQSLSGLVEKVGPLAAQDVIVLGRAVALALAAAHSAGVVHGGIAPNNVLFRNTGEPVVGDFGVTLRQAFTRDPLHAIEYLPPETLRMGTLNEATDLYGLGAVLHFALSARSPHPGRLGEQPGERVLRILGEPVPAINRPDVPIGLSTMVARLLSTTPDRRPPEAAQVAEQLTNMLPNPPKPATREDWDDFDTAAPPPQPPRTPTAQPHQATEEDQDFDDFAPQQAHRPNRPFPVAHNAPPRGPVRPGFPPHQGGLYPPPPMRHAQQTRPPMPPAPGPPRPPAADLTAPPTQELNVLRPFPGGAPVPPPQNVPGVVTPPTPPRETPAAAPVPPPHEPNATNLAPAAPPKMAAPTPPEQEPNATDLGPTTPPRKAMVPGQQPSATVLVPTTPPDSAAMAPGVVPVPPVPPRQEPSATDLGPAAPAVVPGSPGQELGATDLGPVAPAREPDAAGLGQTDALPGVAVMASSVMPAAPDEELGEPATSPAVEVAPGAAPEPVEALVPASGAVSVSSVQDLSAPAQDVVQVLAPEAVAVVPLRELSTAGAGVAPISPAPEPGSVRRAPEFAADGSGPALLPLAALTPAPSDSVLRPDSTPTEAFAAPPTVEFSAAHQPGVVLERRQYDFEDDGFSDFADAGRGPAKAKVLAGPLAPPGQAPKRLIRYDLLAGAALLIALLALVPLLLLRGDPDEMSSTPRLPQSGQSAGVDVQVELAAPVDLTDKVQLSWTASRDFDFAVFVAPEGEEAKVFLAERNHSMTVDVEPGLKYCFMVHATDGDNVYESDSVGLRGATCRT